MFYAIKTMENGMEMHAPVMRDNVYTQCPGCGRHLFVNLENLLNDGISNLEDTYIYCGYPSCGGKTVSLCIPSTKGWQP